MLFPSQRLCYAAQQCKLGRCIGTMVHQNKPLCAVGMAVQSLMEQELSLIQGAWLMISETVLDVLVLAGGVTPPQSVHWPDQAFYGFVCTAKDVSATTISIVMSTIGGIVQSAGQTPVQEVCTALGLAPHHHTAFGDEVLDAAAASPRCLGDWLIDTIHKPRGVWHHLAPNNSQTV